MLLTSGAYCYSIACLLFLLIGPPTATGSGGTSSLIQEFHRLVKNIPKHAIKLMCRVRQRALTGAGAYADWAIAFPDTNKQTVVPESLDMPYLRNTSFLLKVIIVQPNFHLAEILREVFFFKLIQSYPNP